MAKSVFSSASGAVCVCCDRLAGAALAPPCPSLGQTGHSQHGRRLVDQDGAIRPDVGPVGRTGGFGLAASGQCGGAGAAGGIGPERARVSVRSHVLAAARLCRLPSATALDRAFSRAFAQANATPGGRGHLGLGVSDPDAGPGHGARRSAKRLDALISSRRQHSGAGAWPGCWRWSCAIGGGRK